ncbi:MAG: hypothetical protein ACTHMM_08275 [Agriterribacter sp.]
MKKRINLEADFLDFIALCNNHEVRYLIVGGYAVSVHGYPSESQSRQTSGYSRYQYVKEEE